MALSHYNVNFNVCGEEILASFHISLNILSKFT